MCSTNNPKIIKAEMMNDKTRLVIQAYFNNGRPKFSIRNQYWRYSHSTGFFILNMHFSWEFSWEVGERFEDYDAAEKRFNEIIKDYKKNWEEFVKYPEIK